MLGATAVVLTALVAVAAGSALPTRRQLEDMPRDRAGLLLRHALRPHLEAGLRSTVAKWVQADSEEELLAIAPRGLIENQILALLEKLRQTIIHGDPEKNIPALDPFELSHLEVDLNRKPAQISATLDNVTVTGLAGFKVNTLKVSTITLSATFNLTEPQVQAVGEYDTDSVLGDILPVYGAGHFEVNVSNVNVYGKGKLALKGLKPYLKSLTLDIKMGGYKSEFAGLLGGGDLSDLINEVINDLVPEIVDANLPWVSQAIADAAVTLVNKYLGVETRGLV